MFIIVLHFHTWNNLILQEDAAAQYLTVVSSRMMFNQRPSPPLPPPPPPLPQPHFSRFTLRSSIMGLS